MRNLDSMNDLSLNILLSLFLISAIDIILVAASDCVH
jgi:hypothetical protein